jgi:hypothetical protein
MAGTSLLRNARIRPLSYLIREDPDHTKRTQCGVKLRFGPFKVIEARCDQPASSSDVPLCYRARPRIPHVEKKPLNCPQKTARWERARGDEVQRVRIEPQQLRAASPVASPALGAAGGCDLFFSLVVY